MPGIEREVHDFLWVVSFPLFHWDEEAQAYAAEHQPFTLPTERYLKIGPIICGSIYHTTLDGFEAGGGGMRIHNADVQMAMLRSCSALPRSAQSPSLALCLRRSGFGAPPWAALRWV